MENYGENFQDGEYRNTKCNQETQTELFKLSIADLFEPMGEKQKESLWVHCTIEIFTYYKVLGYIFDYTRIHYARDTTVDSSDFSSN